MYKWTILLYSRDDHNIANQLYFNKTLKKWRKKKQKQKQNQIQMLTARKVYT